MSDFNRKVKSVNRHLESLTNARYFYVDGSVTTPQTVSSGACTLVRVILNTNGATVTLKNGSRFVGVIALDAPETPFEYGLYCENGLTVQAGGAVDATVVFEPA